MDAGRRDPNIISQHQPDGEFRWTAKIGLSSGHNGFRGCSRSDSEQLELNRLSHRLIPEVTWVQIVSRIDLRQKPSRLNRVTRCCLEIDHGVVRADCSDINWPDVLKANRPLRILAARALVPSTTSTRRVNLPTSSWWGSFTNITSRWRPF